MTREAAQLVFNLLLGAAAAFPGALRAGAAPCAPAATLLALVLLFEPLDFAAFLRASVPYSARAPASMLELLARSEPGRHVLRAIGLAACPRSPSGDGADHRPRAASMREGIRRAFLERQRSFSPPAELESGDCCICHDQLGGILAFPVLIYRTILPDFIERGRQPGAAYSRSVALRICLHPVHPACHHASHPRNPGDVSEFLCPIDRCLRNGFLPRIHGTAAIGDRALMGCIDAFLSHITGESDPGERLAVMVRSLAGQIATVEVRHRSNRAIDAAPIATLLRNYFLAVWHRQRSHAGGLVDLPPLERLICRALVSDEPMEPFVGEIGNGLEEPYRTAFYRRASLFIRFALHDCGDDTPDLEAVFRDCPTVSLPPLEFCQLPQDILGFLEAPFRIDIANNNEFEIVVCLLTGGSCIVPHGNWRILRTMILQDFVNTKLDGTFSFFFVLTGERAGIVLAADMEFRCVTELRSCYVDEFGEEDRGFARGDVLRLSEPRCAWLIDHLLAGDWADRMFTVMPRQ